MSTPAERVERLRQRMAELQVDALLITQDMSRYYLSGFYAHDEGLDIAGQLLIGSDRMLLVTDGRYTEQATREAPDVPLVIRQAAFGPILAETIRQQGWQTVGLEAERVSVAIYQSMLAESKDAFTLKALNDVVEPLRECKDEGEVERIRQAQQITDETFAHLQGWLRPGLTEKEVAWEILRFMLAQGAEDASFPSIVASGPNAALPHATPTERKLEKGEPITIDMGTRYQGYCSDMTRTLCLGEPDAKLREVHEVVLRAQMACEAGLRADLVGQAADALARATIEQAGYGEYYVHGTGHGVGLEVHEYPRMSRFNSDAPLRVGAVVTIEPGIYIPGWGGVRIEDMGVITQTGVNILTRAPKELVLNA
ncbi:MAG TPA: Xaa-Pro peptidase family protein [Ktedonobacterales bacterium]|jgi:Xaa-Pro aminopeptidase